MQQNFSAFSILVYLNEKKSQMLSQNNQLIYFHLAVTWVNYGIVSARRQNRLPLLIKVSTNNITKDSGYVICSRTCRLCKIGKLKRNPKSHHKLISWFVYAMRTNTLPSLIFVSMNNEKLLSSFGLQQHFSALSIWKIENKSLISSQKNQLIGFHFPLPQ